MKLLLLKPFLLVWIFGCSNQKNNIQQRKIDSSIEKNGVICTLFSKSLLWGILFFTPIGFFQILKILDSIL